MSTSATSGTRAPFPVLPIQGNGAGGGSLQYNVYSVSPNADLDKVLHAALDLVSTWTRSYIWNLDPFSLQLNAAAPKLHGTMCMGDDGEVTLDEWIVVAAFWRLSQQFPDIVIRLGLGMPFFFLM
jgi:SGT1 protein